VAARADQRALTRGVWRCTEDAPPDRNKRESYTKQHRHNALTCGHGAVTWRRPYLPPRIKHTTYPLINAWPRVSPVALNNRLSPAAKVGAVNVDLCLHRKYPRRNKTQHQQRMWRSVGDSRFLAWAQWHRCCRPPPPFPLPARCSQQPCKTHTRLQCASSTVCGRANAWGVGVRKQAQLLQTPRTKLAARRCAGRGPRSPWRSPQGCTPGTPHQQGTNARSSWKT
jgi:hypothetical protein